MQSSSNEAHELAEAVREACIQAALEGYQNAAISGLCAEGALEAAVSAMRQVDVTAVVANAPHSGRQLNRP